MSDIVSNTKDLESQFSTSRELHDRGRNTAVSAKSTVLWRVPDNTDSSAGESFSRDLLNTHVTTTHPPFIQ